MSDSQALASKQGKTFKQLAKEMIEARGARVVTTRLKLGAEWPDVDLEAVDRQGRPWWLHARGSWRGDRPGLIRTDTMRKLIAVVYDLHMLARERGVMQGIITSHLPEDGTGKAMLDRAVERGVVEGVFLVDLELDALRQSDEEADA